MNVAEDSNVKAIIDEKRYTVAAFYQFVSLNNIKHLQAELKKLCQKYEIFGTILLAREGINGTVSGSQSSVNSLFKWFDHQPSFHDIQVKYSKLKGVIVPEKRVPSMIDEFPIFFLL